MTTALRRGYLSHAFLLLCVFLINGCMRQPQWPQPVTLERMGKTDTQQSVPTGLESAGQSEKPGVEEIRLPSPDRRKVNNHRKVDARRLNMTDTAVSVNVENMPLSDFIIHALGETLKITFVMDEAMMNNNKPITLCMPKTMPAKKALAVFLGVLEQEGIYHEEKNGALYIYQETADPQAPMSTQIGMTTSNSLGKILQVVPLKHIRTEDVEPLVTDLFNASVQVKPFKHENVIVLYGRASRMEPVLNFIATFDVPYLQNKKLLLLRLTYWQTDEFIAQLTKIMEGIGFSVAKKSKDPGLRFMPIKQLSTILAVTPDDSSAEAVIGWKEKLDTPEAAGTGFKTYTYIPKYSRASDLLESIHNLYKTLPTAADSETSQTDDMKKRAPRKAKLQDVTAEITQETSFEAPGLKMAADDRKNMILILSKSTAYHDILNLLQTLDIPVRQVLIEATIVELTLTDELQYGVEWFIDNSSQGGSYTLGTLGNLGVESMGLSYSFLSESGKFQSLVSALAEADKANILSTPRLIVLDNMEAQIQVGKDVPIITGEVSSLDSSSSSSTSVYNTVEYRSTGVLLKVIPTINTDGLLTLDITQEVSDISDTSGVSGSPIILTRKISTTIIAAHGQTIVLGGLMKENLTSVENKVPLLGDIPLLGNLFKHTSKTKDKTELLVLVTPTILTNPDDATKVSNQLRKQLDWLE